MTSVRDKFPDQLARTGVVFALLGLVLSIVVFRNHPELVPVAFLVASAAGGLGAVTGFLFGIPKLADVESPDPLAESAAKLASQKLLFNTNLGQVSDWLTKIVIGLGIAQFGDILDGGQWLGDRFASVFDQGLSSSAAATFGMSLVISSAAFSFMLTYLWTTTRLPQVWGPKDRQ